ncbi:hypothetical protein [Pseudodesulfovibrio sp. zrk46]|uniref:hypothetical protein n=1 Tax=Pseudodesulfovibrio sp. zrk46 TaxID=2725288 RepID=UPI0014498F85|nr:hypothetical protein [Pseudodesulfovibrio sp. zrk46]QJB55365.1 hypothetical protein HFN16_02690 [Pseudodesulfovibrio sp. zrk46]
MRHLSRILIIVTTVVVLTLSLALAGTKFKNEDTAKNRQDNTFGTDQTEKTATTTFGTNDSGDTTIKSKSRPKEEPVDWYDKVIITVNPTTRWPTDQTTTTTTTEYDNATDTQTTTTTTQEIK